VVRLTSRKMGQLGSINYYVSERFRLKSGYREHAAMMSEDDFAVRAEPVNGRIIKGFGRDGSMGWVVELRGPFWKGTPVQAWVRFETLKNGSRATRLGPLPDTPEI